MRAEMLVLGSLAFLASCSPSGSRTDGTSDSPPAEAPGNSSAPTSGDRLDGTSGDRPIPIVAADLQWADLDPTGAPGVKIAPVWGNPAAGPFGAFLKLPAGFAAPLHTHTNPMKLVIVSGTYIQGPDGAPEFRLGPGSYLMQPGGDYRHTTSCDKASDCVFFVESDGAFDLLPAKSAAASKPGPAAKPLVLATFARPHSPGRGPMIAGARYGHTNLIARDWRALSRFYQEQFGCTPVPPVRDFKGPDLERGTGIPGAELRGEHLRLPGHGPEGPTLEIFNYNVLKDAPGVAVNRPGFGHIAFVVDDVPAAREAVLAAGGHPVGDVVTLTNAAGVKLTWVYVTDPEGNILELQSRPKG